MHFLLDNSIVLIIIFANYRILGRYHMVSDGSTVHYWIALNGIRWFYIVLIALFRELMALFG